MKKTNMEMLQVVCNLLEKKQNILILMRMYAILHYLCTLVSASFETDTLDFGM